MQQEVRSTLDVAKEYMKENLQLYMVSFFYHVTYSNTKTIKYLQYMWHYPT
jgi:hypothetical protein